MSEYTVEFRVYGENLEPPAVTNLLNLQPSIVRRRGDRRSDTTDWKEGMWAFNGYPEGHAGKIWTSLEEGLIFVLGHLSPVKSEVESLKNDFQVVLWCGHFQTELNSSFTLSPRVLKMLGEFDVELLIDTYASDG
jgi:hypothetical protein